MRADGQVLAFVLIARAFDLGLDHMFPVEASAGSDFLKSKILSKSLTAWRSSPRPFCAEGAVGARLRTGSGSPCRASVHVLLRARAQTPLA